MDKAHIIETLLNDLTDASKTSVEKVYARLEKTDEYYLQKPVPYLSRDERDELLAYKKGNPTTARHTKSTNQKRKKKLRW